MDTGNTQNVLSKLTTGTKGVATVACCCVTAILSRQIMSSIYDTARGLEDRKGQRIFSYRTPGGKQILVLCGLVSAISGYGIYKFGKSFYGSLKSQ